MARAILTIEADASSVTRTLGGLRGEVRSAQAAITADTRAAARERAQVALEEVRQRGRIELEGVRASGRASAERTREAGRESQHRRRLDLETVRSARTAASDRTKVEVAGIRARATAAVQASREEISRQTNTTRLVIAQERERSAAVRREESERSRIRERESRRQARDAQRRLDSQRRYEANVAREQGRFAGRATGAIVAGGRAVGAFATGAHGAFQDARRQRAVANREMGNALRNAGAGDGDVSSAQRRVSAFVDETGMSYADVASALATGQARGSALDPGTGTRGQAMENALRVIREANAGGVDPGQMLAARGRLQAAGLEGNSLRDALRYTMRAAQVGQVEVDQIIQQGLPGASRLMASRLGALPATASAEERQRTALTAFRESVAVQEIAASTGQNAGRTSNTLASLQNFLNTPRRQEMMLNNLRQAQQQVNTSTPEGRARAAALRGLYEGDDSLFERDPTRTGNAMRLREGTSPLVVAQRLAAATGGNAQAAANILAGGGQGNAQSLLVNMRDMIAFLGGRTANGRSGGDMVTQMMSGGGLSDADMEGMMRGVEGDELSALTRAQEKGVTALTDNTSAMGRLSSAFADWAAANPLQAQAANAGGGLLTGLGGGIIGAGLRSLVPRLAPVATAAQGIFGAVNAASSGAGLGTQILGSVLAGGAGLGIGSLLNRALYSDETTQTADGQRARATTSGGQPAYTNAFSGDFWRGFTTSVTQAFDTSIARGTLRVSIDPHDAAQAQSGSRGTAQGRR